MNEPRDTLLMALNSISDEPGEPEFNIIKRLVRNTRFFHEPVERGPFVQRVQKPELKIAMVENQLRVPPKVGDPVFGDVHFEGVSYPTHIAPLQTDPVHPEAERFRGISESTFRNIQMVTLRQDFDFEGYRDQFIEHVEQAISDGADAICFAELAYPHPGCWIDHYEDHARFAETLQKFADEHGILIIAGSYHCLETQTNECPIFIPRERNDKGEFTTPDESPRSYTKRVPAEKIGEIIRRPPGIEFPVYRSTFGKFSVLICLDSFDATFFLRFLSWHTHGLPNNKGRSDDLEVIFVPSYSTNSRGWPMARYLSYVSQCVVVYTDADMKRPNSDVLLCGESIMSSANDHKLEVTPGPYRLATIDMNKYKEYREVHRKVVRDSSNFQKMVMDPRERPGLQEVRY